MQTIRRSALVEHWCSAAELIESGPDRLVARLDLGLGALSTWFTTENTLDRPHSIDMNLVDGPFRKLHGRWEFHALDECASKVTLTLEFDPNNRLLGPAIALGFQGLADRMVDDFVRVADRGE
jgi:ribosome-associated toxin RatA of RatAB toxin-antitoxin module